ncbi:hypothetical protein SUGI_0203080 [Cryptomeria japonica]|uniref:ATP-dependent 6-phosphofructokinase 5, chloroplastic n=1 Tax=Cryptomeria japonica TaxID=3369 RepID=UPI002408B132|nr:ATP-dependent 6-phosphofructokinase 5, chloroplastic [Cryptomeria japonica]GLJ13002.1 hypothetical protein SUGI_0203080 [Cryptomeria japonica]
MAEAALINPNLCSGQKKLPALRSNKPHVSTARMPRVVRLKLWRGSGGRRKGCIGGKDRVHVAASSTGESTVDSGDFDVEQFERDFEERFQLPHLTDLFDYKPIQTTFCIKSSCPLPEDDRVHPPGDLGKMFVHNDDRVLLKVINYATPSSAGAECVDPDCKFVHQWVHRAGPRTEIYFHPDDVKAAIVTCGGLCPGLNDVIRQIVITLEIYGVKNIVGISYGYRGLFDENLPEIPLSRKVVQNIHLSGGSLLGVSRGGGNVTEIVDSIQKRGINMLFVLGGNGTHAGANAIHNECRKRSMKVVVVGVPKTIDNDILLMDKTFGFDTAVEEAQRAINAAYIEAHSAYHGVGIVKLMGRSSGFIAMHASLASGQIDICLIPEIPFILDGPDGVLQHLHNLLSSKGSAVICVAEGAGQDLFKKNNATDASGNPVLADIGVHLQQQIKKHFKSIGMPADVKYIDPTYMIRAIRANAADGILCTVLGQNAVHGAFAGFSGITVGICNTHYVYLPIPEVIQYARAVDPNSRMWHRCLTSTGQPDFH